MTLEEYKKYVLAQRKASAIEAAKKMLGAK